MFRNTVSSLKVHLSRSYHKNVSILGVPFEKGQMRPGVESGPKVIRDHGLIKSLKTIEGLEVVDLGDLKYEPEKNLNEVKNMQHLNHVASCMRLVSQQVQNVIKQNKLCVTLGGDHTVGVGTVDGHVNVKGDDISVIWIDAHADLNTNYTSPSGNIHGMSLGLLVRELSDYWPYLPGMDWQKPLLSLRNVAYIGLRSVDSYERLLIDKFGITAFAMEDIEHLGITTVVQLALNKIDPKGTRSIHVSFDIDSLDSLEAPSTGTAVRGGLTLREGISAVEQIHRTGRLNAFDLVEVNPKIGTEYDIQKTVEAAIHILMAACGHQRRGLISQYNQEIPLQTIPSKKH